MACGTHAAWYVLDVTCPWTIGFMRYPSDTCMFVSSEHMETTTQDVSDLRVHPRKPRTKVSVTYNEDRLCVVVVVVQ